MTSQNFKHPDWDELCEKVVPPFQLNWLRDYAKSHDINQCTDAYGNTLLHWAVQLRNGNVIYDLFNLLIDPNIKNAAGQTALQISQSMQTKSLWLLHFYLCIDFDKGLTEPNGLDALFTAIYRGDTTLGDTSGVKDDGNEQNEGKWTALQCAVMYNRPHLIRELHQRFPNLNPNYKKGAIGCQALCLAAMYGHSNCIIALCECFPAIDAGDALQVACQYNRPACIPILHSYFPHLTGNELATYRFPTALMRAALFNNPECIRMLHSCFPNIDPDLLSTTEETALIATADSPICSNCLPALAQYFPNLDPNKQNKFGFTALTHAIRRGSSNWIVVIRSYFPNIDVNVGDKFGYTPLMTAIDKKENCLVALCESFPDIDPNIQDNDGNTALIRAMRNYNAVSIVPQLHRWFPNIDPNIQNNNQETALMRMLVSKHCSVQSMCQFLDTFPNIDVNIQNAQGETALTIVIKKGHVSLIALLLERFPAIYLQQHSALVVAIEKNRIDALSVLLEHIIDVCHD